MRSHNFASHPDGMPSEPTQRPEGRLLAEAIERSGLSARQVASQIPRLSDTRLRQIINGYQPVGDGQRISVKGPAKTLAKIAMFLEITADELRGAGRPDAAAILDMQGARAARGLAYLIPQVDEQSDTDRILERLQKIEERLTDVEARVGGRPHLSGVAKEGVIEEPGEFE